MHSGVIISFQLHISGVPGKPHITNTKKEIERSFTLKWSPPSYDGGDNNIMYQVEWGKKPITDKTDRFMVQKIPDTSREIENLENEVEYEFRVMAKNQAGAGEPDIMFFKVKGSTGMYTIETKYVNFEQEFELGKVLQSIIKINISMMLFCLNHYYINVMFLNDN